MLSRLELLWVCDQRDTHIYTQFQVRSYQSDPVCDHFYLHAMSSISGQYDHAYTHETAEDRLDTLSGALWRSVYLRNEGLKEGHVRTLAQYVDSELAEMYEVDKVRSDEKTRLQRRKVVTYAHAEGTSRSVP